MLWIFKELHQPFILRKKLTTIQSLWRKLRARMKMINMKNLSWIHLRKKKM